LYDVLVVGAGPAGTMAAKRCAELGLKVILIEKERIPRPKPCGGGVSLKALKLIEADIPEAIVEHYIRGFRLFSPNFEYIEWYSSDYVGISTRRDKFDAFLTKLAVEKGCELIDNSKVVDVIVKKDKVVCKLSDDRLIEGILIIGADGVNSIVAKKTGIRTRWNASELGLCLETTYYIDKKTLEKIVNPEIFELYFINIPLGYGWVFPKKSSLSLGIGGALTHVRNPKNILMNFCLKISKLKKINLKISQYHAHLIPAGGFPRRYVSDRVILAGDAAGFVDPLTGEGIYYAMKSGLIAAETCVNAIENNETSKTFLEYHYSKICEKTFGKDLKIALDLTYKIHNHLNFFFKVLKASESNSNLSWASLAKGDINYRQLRKKLIIKSPVFLLSFLIKFIKQKLK